MIDETRANQRIRKALEDSGMYHWKLAEMLGVTSWTLSVWLRHEMPKEKQERILQLIREESDRTRKAEQV